jgi:hypothetical protein
VPHRRHSLTPPTQARSLKTVCNQQKDSCRESSPTYLMQLLGRSVDISALLRQRISKLFRENLEFLLERVESTGLPRMLEHSTLMRILQRAHCLLSKQLQLDDFSLMLAEGNETVSMASFSSRIAAQVGTCCLTFPFILPAVWSCKETCSNL